MVTSASYPMWLETTAATGPPTRGITSVNFCGLRGISPEDFVKIHFKEALLEKDFRWMTSSWTMSICTTEQTELAKLRKRSPYACDPNACLSN
jgi:hypothetical protein